MHYAVPLSYSMCISRHKIQYAIPINDNLEAMAKQLYDYWFVQFDFPNENGRPYKSSGGEMVWNEKLKRENTKDWKDGVLFDIANITMGQSPRRVHLIMK